jgi:hypothetical protein
MAEQPAGPDDDFVLDQAPRTVICFLRYRKQSYDVRTEFWSPNEQNSL